MNTMTTTDLTVATEIRRQIGNTAFFMMGAKDLMGDEKSLTFTIRGCRQFTKVRVTLTPLDTYTVEFFKFRKFEVSRHVTVEDVYVENLRTVIASTTGLALSL